MLRVSITNASAVMTETELLTAGRVGLECAFTFSSEWDGLQKVAVFEGADTKEVALGSATIAVVPPECMATEGYKLRIGVYGLNKYEAVVIPTVWVMAGKIKSSASPDETDFATATPSVVAQIMDAAETALNTANAVKAEADSGAFDGADGVSPLVNVAAITGGHRMTVSDVNGTQQFDVMDGEKGDTGATGTAATIAVGTTTTGAAGTSASVTNSGTSAAAVFNFTIPKGDKGDTGSTGMTPEIFATATTLPAGSSASANITGTVEQPLITFGIPKGDKGDTGDAGVYVGTTEPTDPDVTVWIDPSGTDTNTYVVILTPTALDYSGTMDKTVAEIYAAYQAGKKIVFRLATSATTHIDVDVSLVGNDSDYDYPSFEGYVIESSANLLIWAGTGVTDDDTKATYGTVIYTLTPAT